MPITYKIDHDKQRVYSSASDVVTFDELLAHMRSESGNAIASYSEVFDCTGATTNINSADIDVLVGHRKQIAERQEPGPVAIVAGTDLFFGMFRMFDSMTEELRPIRLFRTSEQADMWLDTIEKVQTET